MKEEEKDLINLNFFNDQKMEKFVVYLYHRWQDEQEFEDLNDYGIPVKEEVEKIGGKFLKMITNPFGFQYSIEGSVYQIAFNGEYYSYRKMMIKIK